MIGSSIIESLEGSMRLKRVRKVEESEECVWIFGVS